MQHVGNFIIDGSWYKGGLDWCANVLFASSSMCFSWEWEEQQPCWLQDGSVSSPHEKLNTILGSASKSSCFSALQARLCWSCQNVNLCPPHRRPSSWLFPASLPQPWPEGSLPLNARAAALMLSVSFSLATVTACVLQIPAPWRAHSSAAPHPLSSGSCGN